VTFKAPVAEIAFALRQAGLERLITDGLYPDLSMDLVQAVLEEAGRFSGERIAPLNRPGDVRGAVFEDGAVRMPEGWREVYREWAEAGWNGVTAPPAHGGQGLPVMLGVAVEEMWNAAALAFGLGPLLTAGAVEALEAHAGADLKAAFLDRLVSGEWTGTMNLTEPQAGSDLAAIRTRAERREDGTYRIFGTKIFITYGEHDLTDNIVHLVLARLPDAPPGTRGISLFAVPKFLVNPDGSLGPRNDLRCAGLEHKLGIHASPTCVMVFGDGPGAVGYLVGEENRGLNAMFTMMNNARLAVGIQGVAIAERATQQAFAYAQERRQGRAPGTPPGEMAPIAAHPDVRRMLLTMRGLTRASRAICYACAEAIDRARRDPDPERRRASQERANLLTPVAKAFSTDAGVEIASLGIQVHGGMGYIEETGAAQHLRDARIAPIYEGTNGIQAIDLVTRKLPQSDGRAVRAYIAELGETARRVGAPNRPDFGRMAERVHDAVAALADSTEWMLGALSRQPEAALAGAAPYLRLFGLAAGGAALAEAALEAAQGGNGEDGAARIALARHFAEAHLPETRALQAAVTEGYGGILDPAALAG
jgi:butyryl-CoA dehydrogenase